MSENELIPYQPTPLPHCERVLALAPHPDDEVFGCGGALALHARNGAQVRVIIVSSGERGGDGAVREAESRCAAQCLGLPEPIFWRHQDRSLRYGEALVGQLCQAISEGRAQRVYAPSLWEVHPDHRALALAALEAVRRSGGAVELAFYEVGGALRPNQLLDISAVWAEKQKAMAAFESQLQSQDYAGQVSGLNRFRSYTLGRQVLGAEAFEVVQAQTLRTGQLAYFQSEYTRQRLQGLARPDAALSPLVSVIIRSVDRPQLHDALAALAAQTWSHLEIIVVNAGAQPHSALPPHCGAATVRCIETGHALGRSAAANAGLDAARGEFAGFLDDDDWLAAGHVALLAQQLLLHPALAAVYATTLVQVDGQTIDRYAQPYDRALLHARNYLPIHAVLFRRHKAAACRFDEGLSVYEDWDFWLQLSAQGPFRHLDQETAIYRADQGDSQISAEADRTLETQGTLQVLQKWQSYWTPQTLEALSRELRRQAQAQAAAQQQGGQIQQLEHTRRSLLAQRDGLQARAEQLTQRIAAQDAESRTRETYIARCEERLRDAARESDAREARLRHCEERLAQYDAEAAQRDDYIEEQRGYIGQLTAHIQAVNQHVAGLEKQSGELQWQLRDQREQHARQIAAAQAAEQDCAQRYARLQAAEAGQREQLAQQYAQRVGQLEREHAAVFATLSWRVTAPLRWVRRQMAQTPAAQALPVPVAAEAAPVQAPEPTPGAPAQHQSVPPPQPWQAPPRPAHYEDLPAAPAQALAPLPPCVIILPVYNGYEYLAPLFESLERSLAGLTGVTLVVVNDASPDPRVGPCLQARVARMARQGGALLLDNEVNRGFVHSVNRGMQWALAHLPAGPACPVVILNTDTEVPQGWLQRLADPLVRQPRSVASVTPMTNAGTICSFPVTLVDNVLPAGVGLQALDDAFRPLADCLVDAPTGVGFCMALNSEVLRRIGLFDEEAYGRGYAEENDWCQRAIACGYANVIQAGLFVWHKHGGSFSSEDKQALVARNLATLCQRYPRYSADVQAHIQANPLALARAFAALNYVLAQGCITLVVDHNMGGGANDYRHRAVEAMLAAGQNVLVYAEDFVRTRPTLFVHALGQRFEVPLRSRATLQTLGAAGAIGTVFYNEGVTFDRPDALPQELLDLVRRHGARLAVAMHDYYPVCPSYTLLNHRHQYCGVPQDLDTCRRCLPRNGFMLSSTRPCVDIDRWRAAWGALVQAADELLCFSQSTLDILARAYPALAGSERLHLRPHTVHSLPTRVPTVNHYGPPVLGIVGAIGLQKGSRIVRRLGRLIEARGLGLRIVIIGEADIADFPGCVTVTGRYVPTELPDLIERHGVNYVALPAIWPETFSYVTSELMAMNLRILAFDLGAPVERLRSHPMARIVPEVSAEAMLQALLDWDAQQRADVSLDS